MAQKPKSKSKLAEVAVSKTKRAVKKRQKSRAKVPGRGRGNPALTELRERNAAKRAFLALSLSPSTIASNLAAETSVLSVKKRELPRRQGERMSAEEHADAKERFLAAFAKTGIVGVGLEAAEVSRATYHMWQEHDEEFSFRLNQAREDSNDVIRKEIERRAINGIQKPVYYQGELVDVVTEYSDLLLMFHGKAKMSEYRDKVAVEHSGTVTIADIIRKAVEEEAPANG